MPFRHVLKIAGSNETSLPVKAGDKNVRVRLQLPSGLTCSHCVLQVGGSAIGESRERYDTKCPV